jgi:hypothetical protein
MNHEDSYHLKVTRIQTVIRPRTYLAAIRLDDGASTWVLRQELRQVVHFAVDDAPKIFHRVVLGDLRQGDLFEVA